MIKRFIFKMYKMLYILFSEKNNVGEHSSSGGPILPFLSSSALCLFFILLVFIGGFFIQIFSAQFPKIPPLNKLNVLVFNICIMVLFYFFLFYILKIENRDYYADTSKQEKQELARFRIVYFSPYVLIFIIAVINIVRRIYLEHS